MPIALPRKLAVRGGNGLGDAIYIQSIARHFLAKGHEVEVCTRWPDVYSQLGPVTLSPFRRDRIDRLAHYTTRKYMAGSDQFVDCCNSAGIHERIPFDLGWRITDTALTESLPRDRPLIAVALPRRPMGRADGFGRELLPRREAMQAAVDALAGKARLVMVGGGAPEYKLERIDLDLTNKTTVRQLFDVASVCDGFLGYVSFLVPLAEALCKPGLYIWARRGLNCSTRFVRAITPQKVFHRPKLSRHVIDDCSLVDDIPEAAGALLDAARSGREVSR